MGTARDLVVEQLTNLNPAELTVRSYARLTRQPARPTLMVRSDEVEPVDGAEANARVYRFSLIVLASKLLTDDDSKGGVDDEVDDLAELTLDALDKGPTDLVWTSAKRGVYEPTDSPCYIIAAEIHLCPVHPESEPTP